jgi:hypothetical protein
MENRLTLIKRLNKKGSNGNYYGLYKSNWSIEKAFTTPVKFQGKNKLIKEKK